MEIEKPLTLHTQNMTSLFLCVVGLVTFVLFCTQSMIISHTSREPSDIMSYTQTHTHTHTHTHSSPPKQLGGPAKHLHPSRSISSVSTTLHTHIFMSGTERV